MEEDPELEKRFQRDDRVSSKTRRFLILQLCVIGSVGVLHRIGFALYLYWVFWWYDILVHLLASAWVGLFAYWIGILCGWKRSWAPIVLFVLAIGIAWEFFESSLGMPHAANFFLDTSLDLLCDVVGGALGFFLGKRVESTFESPSA